MGFFKMKQAQALFFCLIALINLVKAQEPIASGHCNFNEESGNTNNYVALVEMDDGSSVIMGFVHGLGPNPLHGFHIHEFGDLSDGCASVGDSFYDLGNITDTVKLTGDAEDSVAGRSIVIYENAGDLGARLKCCNIRVDYIPPN